MLRHVTVISSDGITLYHKSYVKNELDDVLFSALTGAIIAFTKELGDELFSIIMKKQMIYFKSLGEYNIVIFSLEAGTNLNQTELSEILNRAVECEALQVLSNMGVTQNINKQLEKEISEIFDIDPEDYEQDEIDPISIEELTGEAFLEALSKLDTI